MWSKSLLIIFLNLLVLIPQFSRAECPTNLGSCAANDVKTTVKAISILNNDTCTSTNDTIDLRITLEFVSSASKYDLGVFVSQNGQSVQHPTSASQCFGAAPQVSEGFLDLEGPPDTCGDLSSSPVDWTFDVTVGCNIVGGQLTIPSCRVWSQNPNPAEVCTSIAQAGTGSKCDCTPLTIALDLTPCSPSACNDNDACTNDSCGADDKCIHTAISIDDNNACTVDSCNPATGVSHTAIATDDNNACTVDSCNPVTGVSHTAVATNDNNACTVDSCNPATGVSHTPIPSSDGNACTIDACDTSTGNVTHTPVNVDDRNACTIDSCSSNTGVSHVLKPISDNNACTIDTCDTLTGAVTHTPVSIDDNDVCTADACNPSTGVSHTPICDEETTHVTNLGDSPGGTCNASGCDLRGAINATPPGGKVVINDALRGKVIRLFAEIRILKDVTIIGPTPITPPSSFEFARSAATASLNTLASSGVTTAAATVSQDSNMVTISGQNLTRIFNIAPGVNTNLSNTRISDGLARDSGGGIKNLGKLVIDSAVFSNNRVESTLAGPIFGGAIFNSSSASLHMTNSSFSNNAVSSTASNLVSGGAIHSEGLLVLRNSDLLSNKISTVASNTDASALGAAIFSSGSLELSGVSMSDNELIARVTSTGHEAVARAGGVYLLGAGKISETSMLRNTVSAVAVSGGNATAEGGALYNANATTMLGMSNLAVNDNNLRASSESGLSSARGGGLFNLGKISGSNNLLSRNNVSALALSGQALAEGGGLFLRGSASAELATTTIRDNIVSATANSSLAQARGGGLASYGASILTSMTLHHNQLIAKTDSTNLAHAAGGGLFVAQASTMELRSSTLSDNSISATSGSGGQALAPGGAIANEGNLVMRQSTLARNVSLARADGGTIASTGGGVNNLGVLKGYSLTLSRNDANQGANLYNAGHLTLRNSVLSADLLKLNYLLASGGAVDLAGFNLANDHSADSIARFVTDLRVGDLADNGGPTKTMLPLRGSPLIDAGDPDFDLSSQLYDQRGLGFPRVTGLRVDVGAVEFECDGPQDCDDHNAGTDDSCVDLGCVYQVNSAFCDDLNICTTGDHFSDGVCSGTPAAVKLNSCSSIAVDATSTSGATVNFSPTTKDGCYDDKITCTPASGSVFPIGSTNVSCVATGAGSNQDLCMFSVVVRGASIQSQQDSSSGCNASGSSKVPSSDFLVLVALLTTIGLWRKKKFALVSLLALLWIGNAYALKTSDSDAISALESETDGKVMISKATGTVRFAKLKKASRPAVGPASNSIERRQSSFFLAQHSRAFGISNAEGELALISEERDQLGQSQISYQQNFKGLPVFGAQLKVHFDKDGDLTVVNGTLVPDLSVDTKPVYSLREAARVAIHAIAFQKGALALRTQSSRLLIYREGLVQGISGANHLAWEIEVGDGGGIREFVYVDAHNGKIIDQITGIRDGLHRRTYDGERDPSDEAGPNYPSNPTWVEGQLPFPAAGTEPYNLLKATEETYNFFFKTFGFDSFDGKGGIMDIVFNRGKKCPNASWNGTVISFCEGFSADDVTSHEWGHAYTEFTHKLVYKWQSGALNEAYSDIWGETIDLNNGRELDGNVDSAPIRTDQSCIEPVFVNGQPTYPSRRWLLSEEGTAPDLSGPLRDMWNPNCFDNPNRGGTDPLYFCDLQVTDEGGVHENSGVANHGYALLVDGGDFNGFTIRGIGFVKAAAIYWRAQSVYQNQLSDFSDHAVALRQSCEDLRGSFPNKFDGTPSLSAITSDDCVQVANAGLAVELEQQHTECLVPLLSKGPDGEPPRLCKRVVFLADFEDGSNGFVATRDPLKPNAPSGFDQKWIRTNVDLPKNWPGYAFFANDQSIGDCKTTDASSLMHLTSPPITLSNGAGPFVLTFDHYMASEKDVDGGNVWISKNGGAFRQIESSAFIFNPYNTQLIGENADPPNTNPMAGQYAFSGTDLGTNEGSFGQSQINLSGYAAAGDSIRIRFDFGTDCASQGSVGWYVDNVAIYNTTQGTISSQCGVGACSRVGTSTCTQAALTQICTPGAPQAETCNSKDDDCDGVIDDCNDNDACTTNDQCGNGTCGGVQAAPVLQGGCPQDIQISGTTSTTGAVASFSTPQTENNCYSTICDHPSGSTFPIGSTTVTCNATNDLGQEAKCTFKVIVSVPEPSLAAATATSSGCNASNQANGALGNMAFFVLLLSALRFIRPKSRN